MGLELEEEQVPDKKMRGRKILILSCPCSEDAGANLQEKQSAFDELQFHVNQIHCQEKKKLVLLRKFATSSKTERLWCEAKRQFKVSPLSLHSGTLSNNVFKDSCDVTVISA